MRRALAGRRLPQHTFAERLADNPGLETFRDRGRLRFKAPTGIHGYSSPSTGAIRDAIEVPSPLWAIIRKVNSPVSSSGTRHV